MGQIVEAEWQRTDLPTYSGVSVVIPHFGVPEPTIALISALTNQIDAPPLEVIVVDDASPVPFPATPGAIVIRREVNGGFGSTVNVGAANATLPLLLVLNSDLELTPDFVGRLVAGAAPWQPAVAGPRITTPSGADGYSGRRFPNARQHFVEWLVPLARWRSRGVLHRAVGHDTACREGDVRPVDWLVGAALLLPTDRFAAVGGFDERFHMNCEEIDLQRRLRAVGVPSVYLGSVHAVHEGGGSTDSEKRLQWLVESRLRYAEKWGGLERLRVALTVASIVNLGWNGFRRMAGRPLQPMIDFRNHLKIIWSKVIPE